MSISSYRTTIARLTKEKANLDKKASDENTKVARLQGEIARILRSISPSTNASTLRSKQQQIESKQKMLVQYQARAADYAKQSAQKLESINRNLQSLENAEKQERRREEQNTKRQRQEELRHAREVTRQVEQQSRLHAELGKQKYLIDLAMLPKEITVLFLASNPLDQAQLRLDEEVRSIKEKIRASQHRDSVKLESEWAVRPPDILQALNEHKPHIVHFSGHGSDRDELVLQDAAGNTKLVTKEAIVTTMSTMADNIEVVVFNACFSASQAEAVTEHINFAIGMTEIISDDAAKTFAAQFYSAIGFGRSVQNAFDQGVNALLLEGIPEEKTPILYCRQNVFADEVVLVQPKNLEDDKV